MNKFILLGFCAIIGGLLGFAFLGQSDNNPDIDNQTVVENQTEIVIVENQTEIDDNTEIIENHTFKHNFSQFTLLK